MADKEVHYIHPFSTAFSYAGLQGVLERIPFDLGRVAAQKRQTPTGTPTV